MVLLFTKDLSKPKEGLCVDGACSGNPGHAMYRGVDLKTGEQVFYRDIGKATNNIAEFLAICRGFWELHKAGKPLEIWSDSSTAMLWANNYMAKPYTRYADKLLTEAENWLTRNFHLNMKLFKWQTKAWGEIPADFGRK